jgi:hypothetical protein
LRAQPRLRRVFDHVHFGIALTKDPFDRLNVASRSEEVSHDDSSQALRVNLLQGPPIEVQSFRIHVQKSYAKPCPNNRRWHGPACVRGYEYLVSSRPQARSEECRERRAPAPEEQGVLSADTRGESVRESLVTPAAEPEHAGG